MEKCKNVKFRRSIPKSNWGKIVGGKEGNSGCFLNPPTYPTYNYSVTSIYGDTFWLSLDCAVKTEWLDGETRIKAWGLLKRWKKPDINSKEVQEWILQVLGYFKNCYLPSYKSKNVSDLLIRNWNPLKHTKRHRGVDCIRRWFPEFNLTEKHIKDAYWGSKPK